MARKGRHRKLPPLPALGDPTPERAAKAVGIATVPTEAAGIKAAKVETMIEKLLARGAIDERQAAAGAMFMRAAEKFASSAYPADTLSRLDSPAVNGTRVDYSLSERRLHAARRYTLMREALGDLVGLVEGVAVWELNPSKKWHVTKLRAGLDELDRLFMPAA